MKRVGNLLLTIFLISLILVYGLLTGSACQTQPEQSQEQPQENQKQQDNQGILETETGEMQITEDMNAFRSTNIIGSMVLNTKQEQLGNIEDLIINVDNGKIAFAVMSCCGFLGLGEDLFAIPWNELDPMPDQGMFILDVSQQKLEEAPGFPPDDWPAI